MSQHIFGTGPGPCPKSERHWFTIPDWSGAAAEGRSIIGDLTRQGLLNAELREHRP